jgi:hypothetical protein
MEMEMEMATAMEREREREREREKVMEKVKETADQVPGVGKRTGKVREKATQ